MRKFYEDENYDDYRFDIEDNFQHDLYNAIIPVMRRYSRKRGVDPFELLDRYIDITILRLKDYF